jgi:hypothetical protein
MSLLEAPMRTTLATFFLLLGLAVAAVPSYAADDAERATIRALIQSQLDAFASDDGAKAYSFAAPSIRRIFPDEAAFLRMVRESYAAVYRHKDVLFGELSDHGEGRIQAVKLTDETGDTWLALYTLEKQPDGSWLISGCTLVKQKTDRA